MLTSRCLRRCGMAHAPPASGRRVPAHRSEGSKRKMAPTPCGGLRFIAIAAIPYAATSPAAAEMCARAAPYCAGAQSAAARRASRRMPRAPRCAAQGQVGSRRTCLRAVRGVGGARKWMHKAFPLGPVPHWRSCRTALGGDSHCTSRGQPSVTVRDTRTRVRLRGHQQASGRKCALFPFICPVLHIHLRPLPSAASGARRTSTAAASHRQLRHTY